MDKFDGGITVSISAFQEVDPGSTPSDRNPPLNTIVFYSIQINDEIFRAETTIITLRREKILNMKYIIFKNEKTDFQTKDRH